MMLLYVTGDRVGGWTGGSQVTFHESEALKGLGDCKVIDKTVLGTQEDPWGYDLATVIVYPVSVSDLQKPRLAHFYAGTFSTTIRMLKEAGTKITYTAAAHNIDASRQAHLDLGFSFNYPHLNEPELWNRYVEGYVNADLVICPSQHSKECMESYGCKNVVVIPHGVSIPVSSTALPKQFRVGYLGAYGPDKGVSYLLAAWKLANIDSGVLVLAGADSQSAYVKQLVNYFGCKNVEFKGWVDNVADFYENISLYVQPSITEGFGIEVLEALAHSRYVLCSTGAGAADCLPNDYWKFPPRDTMILAHKIREVKDSVATLHGHASDVGFAAARYWASRYTWDKIREQYQQTWKKLLGT